VIVERIRRPLVWGVIAIGICLALATTLREARASGPTPLLPDVVADSPDNVSLAVSDETPTGGQMAPELLLRFNGYVHNIGPGALDFRGSRGAPDPKEPASPPMNVFQRIYNSDGTYSEDPSNAQMTYVNADGHHHWHLQHVAYYSLWNAQKSAEVAPAQKVGFCLEDSERIEETGPSEPIYSDEENAPFGSREFCRQYQPEATDVYEGISEGWRDLYKSNLAFQWVDVSNVLPGEYWLRAEADPEHLIQQTGGEKPPAYAEEPTIVPGFDAQAQTRSVEPGHPLQVTLTSQRWSGSAPFEQPSAVAAYTIVSQPAHGQVSAVIADKLTYTPNSGYTGTDSFTFSARDPNSSFPESPSTATVSIDVSDAPPPPSVSIEGAPAKMTAGTSIGLSAIVGNDTPTVQWSASAGSIASTGSSTATYRAPSTPPPGNLVTVTAESPGEGRDQRSIEIVPASAPEPKPEVPAPTSPVSPPSTPPSGPPSSPPSAPLPGGTHAITSSGPLSSPTAMLIGRKLYMTATANQAGRLRLTAALNGRHLGSCVAPMKKRQALTCTMPLPRGVSARAPIGVWATLRVGDHLFQTKRRPARVPTAMNAMSAASWRGLKQAWRYICGM
jgi:hypothetical protein